MAIFKLEEFAPVLPASGRYYVAENAMLMGKVELGEDASVWFGAVLRGDNELIKVGPRSNVQDGAVLHTDIGAPLTIGADVTVGHQAMLHGCTVDDGALIGMGAIVLNGAVIGAGALIGAGAIVTEGKVIPPGAMVLGAPGKVVRQLTPEQQALILEGSKRYVDNGRRFKAGLKPV